MGCMLVSLQQRKHLDANFPVFVDGNKPPTTVIFHEECKRWIYTALLVSGWHTLSAVAIPQWPNTERIASIPETTQ